jgi:putative hydrolases of HD superfamily
MSESVRHRLEQQFNFLKEIDKAKQVFRQNHILDGSRRENDAEHSWHLAMMALILHEHAPQTLDILKVLKMLLIHDLVEIDAGDIFTADLSESSRQQKLSSERKAAKRIFGLLPSEQANEFLALWEEFEARETPEATFATALDYLGGVFPNYHNKGGVWREHDFTSDYVKERNQPIRAIPAVWEYAEKFIDELTQKGLLREEAE